MNNVADDLWLRLQEILIAFADRLAASDPSLLRDVGRSSNNAFLLRAYLAFTRHKDAHGVAITVDVQSNGKKLTIESDACHDDGKVIASGPSAAISLSEDPSDIEAAVKEWLCRFEPWLLENEPAVAMATSQLS